MLRSKERIWRKKNMNVNGQGRVKIKTRKKFLAAGKAWMALF